MRIRSISSPGCVLPKVRAHIEDGRIISGQLWCFDQLEALGCKTTSRRFARLEFKVLALSQGSSQGEGGRILGFRLRELFERSFGRIGGLMEACCAATIHLCRSAVSTVTFFL